MHTGINAVCFSSKDIITFLVFTTRTVLKFHTVSSHWIVGPLRYENPACWFEAGWIDGLMTRICIKLESDWLFFLLCIESLPAYILEMSTMLYIIMHYNLVYIPSTVSRSCLYNNSLPCDCEYNFIIHSYKTWVFHQYGHHVALTARESYAYIWSPIVQFLVLGCYVVNT